MVRVHIYSVYTVHPLVYTSRTSEPPDVRYDGAGVSKECAAPVALQRTKGATALYSPYCRSAVTVTLASDFFFLLALT